MFIKRDTVVDNKTYPYEFKNIKIKTCQQSPHTRAEIRAACPVSGGGYVCRHIQSRRRRRRSVLVRSARAASIPLRPKEKRGLREVSLQGTQDRGRSWVSMQRDVPADKIIH